MNPSRPLVLLGASRAGRSVVDAWASGGGRLVAIWNRSDHRVPDGVARLTGLDLPPWQEPLVVIGVSDDAIAAVATDLARLSGTALASRRAIVIHLSGSRSLDVLAPLGDLGVTIGAFHPLRAYPGAILDGTALRDVDCAVEGGEDVWTVLRDLTSQAGGHPFRLTAEGRKTDYHLAAAVASNFTVALMDLAVRRLSMSGVDEKEARRILTRLARGTLDNIDRVGPAGALTGPIERGDADVVRGHLDALRDHPLAEDAYRALARLTLDLARRSRPERRARYEAVRRVIEKG